MPVGTSEEVASYHTHSIPVSRRTASPALQGAYRAFSSSNIGNGLPPHTVNGTNAALAASRSDSRPSLQRTSTDATASMRNTAMEKPFQQRKPSPSQTAALLAHRRAMSTQDLRKNLKDRQELLVPTRQAVDGGYGDQDDETHLSPSTQSLVQLYESKSDTLRKTQSVRYVTKPPPPIRSPVPIRPTASRIASSTLLSSNINTSTSEIDMPEGARSGAAAAAIGLASSQVDGNIPEKRQAPKPPQPRRTGTKVRENQGDEVPRTTRSASVMPMDPSPKPGKGNETRTRKIEHLGMPSKRIPSQKSAPSLPSLVTETVTSSGSNLAIRSSRPSMDSTIDRPSVSSKPSTESASTLSHHMSVDSLANAIVASSLASSRAPSPKKTSPMPPPPSHRLHIFHRNQSQEQISRTPSPAKAMRHTMRAPPTSEDDTDHRNKGRSHLMRKHPNKHHEGDRKRWRTQITEQERRRYEGVWAANKGTLLTPDSKNAGTAVLNIVVRDIWRRSRLTDEVLEEVWDLVNLRDSDRLVREEFVVGMWLIDQRLKGNKLPIKVSESIWSSVRRLEGIKIPKHPG